MSTIMNLLLAVLFAALIFISGNFAFEHEARQHLAANSEKAIANYAEHQAEAAHSTYATAVVRLRDRHLP